MIQRDQLIARIQAQKEATRDLTKPVVGLEEFFEGNEDYGSIGCNLAFQKSQKWFREAFSLVEE